MHKGPAKTGRQVRRFLPTVGLLMTLIVLGLSPVIVPSASLAQPTLKGTVEKTVQVSVQTPVPASAIRSPGVIGIELLVRPTAGIPPVINVVYPGTPAAQAGLQPNDWLVAVNGQALKFLSKLQVDAVLPDTPGTWVTVDILREAADGNGRMNAHRLRLQVAPLARLPGMVQARYAQEGR